MTSKQDERNLALKLYAESRLPVEEIASIFGVSRQTIHAWLKAANIPQRGPMGPRKTSGVDTGGDAATTEISSTALTIMQVEHGELLRNQENMVRQLSDLANAVATLKGSLDVLIALSGKGAG